MPIDEPTMPRDCAATKFCIDCKQTKPVSLFYRNRRVPGGYSVYCKVCQGVRQYGSRDGRVHKGKQRVLERIAADRKLCKRCGEVKSLSQDFYISRQCADGHTLYCKVCHRAEVKRTTDPERARQYAERYRFLHRDSIRLKKAAYDQRRRREAQPPPR